MKLLKIITIFFFIAYPHIGLPEANPLVSNSPCHPKVDSTVPQYIIGYGSLIQTESKKKTYQNSGKNLPVLVDGYRRGWFQRGVRMGVGTTFLGVIHSKVSEFNGVIFKLPARGIAYYDKREIGYCRELVSSSHIKMLNQQNTPKGQFWIYVSEPEKIAAPSSAYPLAKAYVDIFMSGCTEIQQNYHLKNFTRDCINTTHNWPPIKRQEASFIPRLRELTN